MPLSAQQKRERRAAQRAAEAQDAARGQRKPDWVLQGTRGRLRCACFLARRWTSAEKTASLWGPDSAKIARAS